MWPLLPPTAEGVPLLIVGYSVLPFGREMGRPFELALSRPLKKCADTRKSINTGIWQQPHPQGSWAVRNKPGGVRDTVWRGNYLSKTGRTVLDHRMGFNVEFRAVMRF